MFRKAIVLGIAAGTIGMIASAEAAPKKTVTTTTVRTTTVNRPNIAPRVKTTTVTTTRIKTGNTNFKTKNNFQTGNKTNFKANNNFQTGNKGNFQTGNKANFQGGNKGNAAIGNAKLGIVGNNAKLKAGPGALNKVAFKPASNVKFAKIGNNKSAVMWKGGGKKMWWGNKWRVFLPLTALGVVALGGAYYYPDAYLTTSRNYCEGITPDGCRLNWQRVEFEDGDGDWQCVQYCRRPGMPPPARTVALVAPPPPPQGGACEISFFSEPGFAGTNATANDEQPRLGEIGWQNQIASVKVAAGTWDLFSDQEFTGETMRLQPGEYADLGPEWTKKAGSFMCVQP
jgi:hypothetical protein